jgi:UDP-N-acetylmuramoylalanine--D-glutamate ligase
VFIYDGWIVAKLNGSTERICPVTAITLRGQHNVENVLAATACALWMGLASDAIRRRIGVFRGVSHRIERVAEERGVVYYNDSKGTNVASTIRALESFPEPIVLIAGGKGKGQDFSPLADAARGRVRQAVLIGADRAAIRAALESAGVSCADASSMREAVATARSLARTGEVVLLSPACASFDMFDNFEHRGEVFMTVVHELTHA